jgi:hypothetical protein
MDNLNTHKPGSRYEALPPAEAKRLWERFEFVYTPRHGSWLHMAEIELNVSIRHNVSAEEWKIWSRLKRPWRLGRIIETTGKPGSTGSSQRRTPA